MRGNDQHDSLLTASGGAGGAGGASGGGGEGAGGGGDSQQYVLPTALAARGANPQFQRWATTYSQGGKSFVDSKRYIDNEEITMIGTCAVSCLEMLHVLHA